jgi:phospholipid/cholesterol/gamma-HCH transport system substrate-binding protein
MRWSLVPRLTALVVVVLLGVYYVGVDVLGFNLGPSPYKVSALLPRAGGVYASADVTYRGVPVGKVAALHLSQDGVTAVLEIKHGVKIPDNATANVRQLSALGEQYIDLVPAGPDATDLHDGSVIPMANTSVPTPIGTTLSDVGNLLKGINPTDIQTIEGILYNGFNGSGSDLRTIVVTGQALANALIQAAPGTVQLVVDGNTVLQTALKTNTDFATFTHQINQLSATFKDANANIQALLANGVAAADQVNPLLAQDTSSISGFVANLGSAGTVSLEYQPAVQSLFAVLPVVASDLSAVGANGTINGEIAFNTINTVCSYIPASQQALPTAATGPAPLDNTCHFSAPDLLQRGAQHAPVVP